MIFFYFLVSIMPLMRHPLWSSFVGDLTMVKYVGVASFFYALFYLPARRRPLHLLSTPESRWYLLFTLCATLSYLTIGTRVAFEISPFLSYLSFLLFFFVTAVVTDSLSHLRYILLVAIASVGYASLHVIREWQKYGDMATGYRPGWVTGDPNYFSLSALLCLPVAFYLLRTAQPQWQRWVCRGSLLLTLLAITLAASRGGFLGLLASMLLVAWRSPRRLRNLLVLSLVVLLLSLIAPSSPLARFLHPEHYDQNSAGVRLQLWEAGIRMIRAFPLTGVGLGNWSEFLPRFFSGPDDELHIAHNAYIEIAAEMGVGALILFLLILVYSFRTLETVRRSAAALGHTFLFNVAAGMQAGLLGFVVAAFFVSAEYQKLFWLFLFITMCLPPLLSSARKTMQPLSPHRLADVSHADQQVVPSLSPSASTMAAAGPASTPHDPL